MNQGTVNWIGTYMEWTSADDWAFGPGRLAQSGIEEEGEDIREEFAAAYLDWMDAGQ